MLVSAVQFFSNYPVAIDHPLHTQKGHIFCSHFLLVPDGVMLLYYDLFKGNGIWIYNIEQHVDSPHLKMDLFSVR